MFPAADWSQALEVFGIGFSVVFGVLIVLAVVVAVFGIYRSRVGAVLTAGVDQRTAVKVSHLVQTRWHEFARGGVPGEDWPAYNRVQRPVLVFDRHTHIEYDPHPHRREAWAGFTLAAR